MTVTESLSELTGVKGCNWQCFHVFAQWATDFLMWFRAALGNLKELLKLTSQHETKKNPRATHDNR